eukprot:TRINITY_DN62994_c0_g1_i1.p1 TRINITY_DN62994_c0_g1~~TRINITY_DN62994_c0_g1_i1.p1  ORF type:complete len:137 (+),score=5.73 TRINITY_DN62994_c0_g1_i1:121-531(+)
MPNFMKTSFNDKNLLQLRQKQLSNQFVKQTRRFVYIFSTAEQVQECRQPTKLVIPSPRKQATLTTILTPAPTSTRTPKVQTLLIDNYDSYTYNLFQILARVNNTEPVVIRNDEVTKHKLRQIISDDLQEREQGETE